MDEATVRMQAYMYGLVADMEAIKVKIEGMKRRNELNEIGYDEVAFFDEQSELEELARRFRQEV